MQRHEPEKEERKAEEEEDDQEEVQQGEEQEEQQQPEHGGEDDGTEEQEEAEEVEETPPPPTPPPPLPRPCPDYQVDSAPPAKHPHRHHPSVSTEPFLQRQSGPKLRDPAGSGPSPIKYRTGGSLRMPDPNSADGCASQSTRQIWTSISHYGPDHLGLCLLFRRRLCRACGARRKAGRYDRGGEFQCSGCAAAPEAETAADETAAAAETAVGAANEPIESFGLYETLGVRRDATAAEIKTAYRKLVTNATKSHFAPPRQRQFWRHPAPIAQPAPNLPPPHAVVTATPRRCDRQPPPL